MTKLYQPARTRPIVNTVEFRGLPDSERRLAYMAAYGSLHQGAAQYPEKRRELLRQYVAIAGWDDESLTVMQAAAVTPVR